MYAFPLILVVTHYLLWFESLLILNNPVSMKFLNYLFFRINLNTLVDHNMDLYYSNLILLAILHNVKQVIGNSLNLYL